MRVLIILTAVLAAAYASAISKSAGSARSALDDQIVDLLECIRDQMPNGIQGSPPLDPLFINFIDINKKGPLTLDGYIANFSVAGLSDFEINKIKVNMLRTSVTYDLTFKSVRFEGFYEVDGTAGGFLPMYGKGLYKIELNDIHISGVVKLRMKGLNLDLSGIGLKFEIGSLFVDIEGLLGGGDLSDLMNRVLNDILPDIIERKSDKISAGADNLARSVANPFLHDMTFSSLIGIIQGGGGGLCSSEEVSDHRA